MSNQPGITSTTQTDKAYRVGAHGIDMQQPITLYSAAGETFAKGTVLGKISATGYYACYVDGHIDGTEVATGMLTEEFVVAAAAAANAVMDIHGLFDSSECTGYDAAAAVDLAGMCKFI